MTVFRILLQEIQQECEKISELRVPRSPFPPASVSCTGDAKNLDEELEDTFQLNLNQNQHYSVINWADEISYEEPTNIPNWALLPGLDFDRDAKDDSYTTDNVDDFNQFHHQYVFNWADEPVHDGPVDVPDWALIPGLDYDRHVYSVTQENVEDVNPIHHTFVINWAEEPVYDGAVDIPNWALIPDFKFNVTPKISEVNTARVTDLDSDADDETVDVPEFNCMFVNKHGCFKWEHNI